MNNLHVEFNNRLSAKLYTVIEASSKLKNNSITLHSNCSNSLEHFAPEFSLIVFKFSGESLTAGRFVLQLSCHNPMQRREIDIF